MNVGDLIINLQSAPEKMKVYIKVNNVYFPIQEVQFTQIGYDVSKETIVLLNHSDVLSAIHSIA